MYSVIIIGNWTVRPDALWALNEFIVSFGFVLHNSDFAAGEDIILGAAPFRELNDGVEHRHAFGMGDVLGRKDVVIERISLGS